MAKRERDGLLCEQVAKFVREALLEIGGGDAEWRQDANDTLSRTVSSTVGRTTRNVDLDHDPAGKPWNVEIRTAPAIYKRYRNEEGILSLLSPFGVQRSVASAHKLACCLLPAVETACLRQGLAQHVTIQPRSGIICLVTPLRARILQEFGGRRPCPFCPVWCSGEKGLWWHVQEQHGQGHSSAVEQVQRQREEFAMVVYDPDQLDNQLLKSSLVGGSTFDVATRKDTDDPWYQVKEGDLLGFQEAVQAGKIDPATELDYRGALPLHWAAGAGHLALVRYLVQDCHCDPNAGQRGKRAFQGRTALHWAARKGHAAVVRYLLEEGHVDLHAATVDGTTAFQWAAWQAHHDVLEVLVSAREEESVSAVVRHLNSYGCNAALWAAQGEGTVETMEWLESAGCPMQVVNHSGHGVLHKAAQRGRQDVCEWFVTRVLERKINDDGGLNGELALQLIGPDNDGCMPSDLAGMEGNQDLALYLAKQEEALVVRALQRNEIKESTATPDWFFRAAVPSNDRIWEPWAGVARLRHACQL